MPSLFHHPFPRIAAVAALGLSALSAHPQAFTIQQALSAPFASDLVAGPHGDRFAWVENEQGRRNLYIATPNASGAYESKRLTAYDTDDGQEMYSLAFTPDAERLIYVRGGDSEFPGRTDPNPAHATQGVSQSIWLIAASGASGSAPQKLGDGFGPAVSPAGDQVAFLAHGQIFTASLNGPPNPHALLRTRGEISWLTWAPDAHALAFITDRGDHAFIAVYDLQAASLTYLSPSTENDNYPIWSPDSKQVAFVRIPGFAQPVPHNDRTAPPWSLIVANAATGEGHAIWKASEGPGSAFHEIPGDPQLLWTADNFLVFPWEGDGWSHLYAVPAAGGVAHILTPGNFEAEDIALSADKKSVLYNSNQATADPNDAARRHIWQVAAAGGTPTPLTSGAGIEIDPAATQNALAFLHTDVHTPSRPALLVQGRMQDLAPQLIPADFPGQRFVTPQPVRFTTSDGLEIHSQLFLPANASDGHRHPALVFFHGGSRRQMLLGFHTMGYYSNAYAMNQYLCSLGYIVLSVNYRSGTGYGLNFREALHYGRDGASEVADILAAGHYLQSRPDVDRARIGAWGGSWGGYMVAAALSRASDIFRAGVDMHGVHHWSTPSSWRTPNDPAADAQTLRTAWDASPIAHVDTWKSPVLLIQGDDDRNVPFSETVTMARALRKQGVDFEELVFPDEIHGFLLQRSWIAAYTAEAGFFQRKLLQKK